MLGFGFSEALATSGFAHRATPRADGTIIYRLADGSGHVLVRSADWNRLNRDFEFQVAPIRKRTKRLCIILFPATFMFGMTLGQFLPFSGVIIVAAVLLGPIAIYL